MSGAYRRREKTSFVPCASKPYLGPVRKDIERKEGTVMTEFRTPSAAELYALERIARAERSKAVKALLKQAVRWARSSLAGLSTKPYAPSRPKEMRHA
jgi:hypothetical protein